MTIVTVALALLIFFSGWYAGWVTANVMRDKIKPQVPRAKQQDCDRLRQIAWFERYLEAAKKCDGYNKPKASMRRNAIYTGDDTGIHFVGTKNEK